VGRAATAQVDTRRFSGMRGASDGRESLIRIKCRAVVKFRTISAAHGPLM
jgi:hypothetical protein